MWVKRRAGVSDRRVDAGAKIKWRGYFRVWTVGSRWLGPRCCAPLGYPKAVPLAILCLGQYESDAQSAKCKDEKKGVASLEVRFVARNKRDEEYVIGQATPGFVGPFFG
jgi:hypothetical protein